MPVIRNETLPQCPQLPPFVVASNDFCQISLSYRISCAWYAHSLPLRHSQQPFSLFLAFRFDLFLCTQSLQDLIGDRLCLYLPRDVHASLFCLYVPTSNVTAMFIIVTTLVAPCVPSIPGLFWRQCLFLACFVAGVVAPVVSDPTQRPIKRRRLVSNIRLTIESQFVHHSRSEHMLN